MPDHVERALYVMPPPEILGSASLISTSNRLRIFKRSNQEWLGLLNSFRSADRWFRPLVTSPPELAAVL
jgi:hypothetical protein